MNKHLISTFANGEIRADSPKKCIEKTNNVQCEQSLRDKKKIIKKKS